MTTAFAQVVGDEALRVVSGEVTLAAVRARLNSCYIELVSGEAMLFGRASSSARAT